MNEFKIGQKVHAGFFIKGGCGVIGNITEIMDRHVMIINDMGRVYKSTKYGLTLME